MKNQTEAVVFRSSLLLGTHNRGLSPFSLAGDFSGIKSTHLRTSRFAVECSASLYFKKESRNELER